jgi:hypothetical protein
VPDLRQPEREETPCRALFPIGDGAKEHAGSRRHRVLRIVSRPGCRVQRPGELLREKAFLGFLFRPAGSVLKSNGVFAVSHFDSSEAINKHHGSCHAVKHDHLPDEPGMRALFQKVDLNIEVFIDEPGFYCIISRK